MKKKLILNKVLPVILVIFFLNQIINQNVAQSDYSDRDPESDGQIIFLNADSHYDYGLKVGNKFRLQYKLLDILVRVLKKNNFNANDVKDQLNAIDQYCPFFLEELRGLAASTNIKLERLLYLKSFLSSFGGSCSLMLATGNATKNNETFLINNIDNVIESVRDLFYVFVDRLAMAFKLFWVKDVSYSEFDYKYVYYGIPVIMEFPIINEKGLGFGVVGTKATKNESRDIDIGPGIDMDMLRSLAMFTCKNVSEVACLYKSMERMSTLSPSGTLINDVTAWCDSEGSILMIEETNNYITTVFGNSTEITGAPEEILWHANHHQWLDPNLTGSIYPGEYPSSELRAIRTKELLEDNYGNINLEICKQMAGDHGGGFNPNRKDSGDICRHSDKRSIVFTVVSFIINPKELTLYVSPISPCKGLYLKCDFSKKLT